MKKNLVLIIILSIFHFNGFSQTEKTSFQTGLTVLPIYDILNIFPEADISGIATVGNFGFFIKDNLSIGINPYFAKATSSYNTQASDFHRERQEISLYGLNTYMRYYFIKREKFIFYSSASTGFGNIRKRTTNLSTMVAVDNGDSDKSTITFMTGFGVDYIISKNILLELNIPYIYQKYISAGLYDNNFQTIMPTIGVQFHWK